MKQKYVLALKDYAKTLRYLNEDGQLDLYRCKLLERDGSEIS